MSERETVTSGLPLDADVGPGDEDDEIVFGFTLEEMFLTANGIMALALAYMAILARSDKLPYLPRHSFYDHVVADHAANSTSDSHSLPVELVRAFFAQAGQTHGGMFVVNSLFALFAALTLSLSVELSRTRLTRSVGPSSASRLAAWFPVACQGVGVSGMFPWAWAWVIKQKRRFPTPRSVNNDVSPPHALLACAAALTLVGLQHLMALLPDRTEVLLAFLGVPVVLPLFGLALPHPEEPSSSPQAQRLTAFAVIATFLCLGTHGVLTHMGGFEALEEEMKLTGKGAVDLIVRDCLQTSPSRFLFVEFVHLVLSAVIYARHEMRGSGGMVFVAITAMAGPTGSFALLAAHHEFQTLRARKLI